MDVQQSGLERPLCEWGKALVVEDDSTVRSVICEMLQLIGFDTISAGNAGDALSLLDSGERFDLMLTDVRMPGTMDGATLAATAKDLFPSLLIVVVTGFAGDRLATVPEGMPILWKPFLFQDLRVQIELLREARKKVNHHPSNDRVRPNGIH